jgi:Flp pilus assembly protein TadD
MIKPFVILLLLPVSLHAQIFDHNTAPAPQSGARIQANAALADHDFARALKLLAPLAAADPKDARLLYDLGSAQDALDQSTPAETSYKAAIADDPAFLDPRVTLGLLLAREAKFPEAREVLAVAAALPTTDDNKLLKARADRALARLDQQSRPADARDELLEALKLSPETPDDTLLAAELAQAAGNGGPAAEAAYRRLLAQRPADPDATAALAHLLTQSKRPAEAEPLLTTALAAHPGDPTLTAQLASLYAAQGKSAQAMPLVEALNKSNPQDPNIARLLASLYLDTQNYTAAEPLLTTLSLQNPQDYPLLNDRADALIHLRRFAEAERLLAPAVAQPARWPTPGALGDAAAHLAFASSENNDPAGALQALAVRATVLPPSAPALFLAAISYDKLHQTKLALGAYQQFLAASNGANPDEEFEAHGRIVALQHTK